MKLRKFEVEEIWRWGNLKLKKFEVEEIWSWKNLKLEKAMKTKFTLTNPNLHSPQLYFQTIAIIWLNRLSGYFSGWMGGCRLLELILSSASARLNWSWAELGKNYSRGILMQMNNFHFVSFLPFWLEIFADF